MKLKVSAALLLFIHILPARAESEFQINCPGRSTMTVVRASYGLSMLIWSEYHLQLASGEKLSHLTDGDSVSITQFRNGDELIRDRSNKSIFFDFFNTDHPVACTHTDIRDLHAYVPTPYVASRSNNG